MARRKTKNKQYFYLKYPPSEPCTCEVCVGYCVRPGWWTVDEASLALDAGYGNRMMLEIAPERTFGVLAPAFKGCEKFFATKECAENSCTFLKANRCELFGTGYQPLECRFCHHDRRGLGPQCHADLENNWKTPTGQALVDRWTKLVGLNLRLGVRAKNRT